jgi:hypothetical protein
MLNDQPTRGINNDRIENIRSPNNTVCVEFNLEIIRLQKSRQGFLYLDAI